MHPTPLIQNRHHQIIGTAVRRRAETAAACLLVGASGWEGQLGGQLVEHHHLAIRVQVRDHLRFVRVIVQVIVPLIEVRLERRLLVLRRRASTFCPV